MKTIYWGLLSLWLALAGCTKGVDDEPTPAGATPATDETPFYGTIETDADTRCATKDSDGQIDVHWNPTDEIALFKGCPLCSCYGVQPDQNDPSHCELYFKEGAHGDQFGGATIEYDANYALHPYYADGVACDKVGGVPTMTFSLPATQRYNAAACRQVKPSCRIFQYFAQRMPGSFRNGCRQRQKLRFTDGCRNNIGNFHSADIGKTFIKNCHAYFAAVI